MLRSHGWILAVLVTCARFASAQPAPPAPEPTPPPPPPAPTTEPVVAPAPSPAAPDTATESADKIKQKLASVQAAASQPQLVALRGGTLGILSPTGNEGVTAALDTKLGDISSVTADGFAKIGGLKITDRLTIDVIGETFKADIPRVQVGMSPAIVEMASADMASVGFRVQYHRHAPLWASKLSSTACQQTLAKDNTLLLNAFSDTQKLVKTKPEPTDADKNSCGEAIGKPADEDDGLTVAAGLRFGRRGNAQTDLTNAKQVMLELMARYRTATDVPAVFFVGGSWTHLNADNDKLGDTVVLFPRYNELRTTLGAEVIGSKPSDGSDLRPIGGIYFSAARNYWTDDFNVTMPADKISGVQLEAGIYGSGHFTGGFSGMIVFSMLRPYDHKDDYQFIVSIIPSVSATPPPSTDKK